MDRGEEHVVLGWEGEQGDSNVSKIKENGPKMSEI